jgi:hypothetical protein
VLEEEREKDKSNFISHQQIVKRWFDKNKAKDDNFEVGDFDPGGYWWPPTFSNWLKTSLWQFWQFTIFSRF